MNNNSKASLISFVDALNNNGLGDRILSQTEKQFGELREWGLEDRIISGLIEPFVVREIMTNNQFKKFQISVLKKQNRTFYDWKMGNLLLNFKATKCLTQDNLSAQGAVLYTLHGNEELAEKHKRLSNKYPQRLKEACAYARANKVDNDFVFLILSKTSGQFDFCSLRTMNKLVMNQSNWLQASWADNIGNPVERTREEYIEWISSLASKYRSYGK